MDTIYQIYAIRYAHLERTARNNFINGDPHDGPMPLDYYVWAITGAGRNWVLDTGFDAAMAAQRKRQFVRPVGDGLQAIGIDPATVQDVIISHMHYDHAGNRDLFPQARYHLQDEEMSYCTGAPMCHELMRGPFEAADVQAMVGRVFCDRVVFHDGEAQLAPGLTLHRVGGHTRGLQVVRVRTARGWVVLASDAMHFYANWQQRRPFPSSRTCRPTWRPSGASKRWRIPGTHHPGARSAGGRALSARAAGGGGHRPPRPPAVRT